MANLISQLSRRGLSGLVALLLIVSLPLTAFADPDPTVCTPPSASTSFHYPNGADSSTFVYNCGNGLWENAHFNFDPANSQRTPRDPVIYTCDPASRTYNATVWSYSPAKGDFVSYVQNVSQPPAGASVVPCPPLPDTSSINGTGAGSTNTIDGNGNGGASISNTGADSNNQIDANGSNTLNSDNLNNMTVANFLNAQANSGNVMLFGNTTAGNGTSGNAQDIATIVNMLQSSSNALGSGNVVTFVKDINGDVNGDLLFDPAMLGAVQPASAPLSGDNSLTINNTTNAALNNTINLGATSGDTTVDANTTAGDATTGSAKVIANVVNLINSAISSGKSFIGTININGNLNGDILLPPDLIDQMIAANVPTVTITNTGANSTNTVNKTGGNNTDVTNTNNLGITNNVNAGATSGNANLSQNTTAGNATTGNAVNSLTAFNLTGSNVLGKNAMLVFVNVTGKWVGLIVNAPPGATAAALGGGLISQTGADSNNAINANGTNNTDIKNNVNATITNDINVNATSGNANVTRNTMAGNARTGDATTDVNLLNVENSSLSFSDWFGILFINVFGTWNGSFGVNTSAGDPVFASQGVASGGDPKVFNFVPGGVGTDHKVVFSSPFLPAGSGGGTISNTGAGSNNAIVAATSGNKTPKNPAAPVGGHTNWWLVGASGTLLLGYMLGDRFYELYAARRPNGLPNLLASLRHFLF